MLLRDEFVSTSLCIHNCFLEGWRFELMLSWSRAGIDRNLCLEKTHILVKSYYVCWKQKLNANNVNNHNMWSQKIMVNRQKDVSPHLKGQEEKSLKTNPQLTGSVLGFWVFVDPTSSPRSFRPEGIWPSTCLEQSIGGDTVAVVLVVLVVTNRLQLGSDEKASESTSGFGVVVVVLVLWLLFFFGGNCPCKKRRV